MNTQRILLAAVLTLGVSGMCHAILIDFDDVSGNEVDITYQYAPLGVTLNAIDNAFPMFGPYPAPPTLPTILGGVSTWVDPFPSATSPPQVAVAMATPESGNAGDGGILISFAFDVNYVSLVGTDVGFTGGLDDESVTLTAYDASGNQIGQVFSTENIPAGEYDITPAAISLPGMRYVAFNYTDSEYGFYAIDDLEFIPSEEGIVPEPATLSLVGLGLAGIGIRRFRRKT